MKRIAEKNVERDQLDRPAKRTRAKIKNNQSSHSIRIIQESLENNKITEEISIDISETQDLPPKVGDYIEVLWQKSGCVHGWYSGRVTAKLSYSEDFIIEYEDGEIHCQPL